MDLTMEQYEGADAILNMYGSHSPYWDYALSNKLYFAARLGLPILVCPETAMSDYSVNYSFGYPVRFDDSAIKNQILSSYEEEALRKRHSGCDRFLNQVARDSGKTRAAIEEVVYYTCDAGRA